MFCNVAAPPVSHTLRAVGRDGEALKAATAAADSAAAESARARCGCLCCALQALCKCLYARARLRDGLTRLLFLKGGCGAVRGGADAMLWKLCFHIPIQEFRQHMKQVHYARGCVVGLWPCVCVC